MLRLRLNSSVHFLFVRIVRCLLVLLEAPKLKISFKMILLWSRRAFSLIPIDALMRLSAHEVMLTFPQADLHEMLSVQQFTDGRGPGSYR